MDQIRDRLAEVPAMYWVSALTILGCLLLQIVLFWKNGRRLEEIKNRDRIILDDPFSRETDGAQAARWWHQILYRQDDLADAPLTRENWHHSRDLLKIKTFMEHDNDSANVAFLHQIEKPRGVNRPDLAAAIALIFAEWPGCDFIAFRRGKEPGCFSIEFDDRALSPGELKDFTAWTKSLRDSDPLMKIAAEARAKLPANYAVDESDVRVTSTGVSIMLFYRLV